MLIIGEALYTVSIRRKQIRDVKLLQNNATSVTASSVKFNPKPYVNKWGDYRYLLTFEIFVHNFKQLEKIHPVTNSIVTDPSKFDATEIKNDPTAAKRIDKKNSLKSLLKMLSCQTAQSNLDAKQEDTTIPVA